MVKITISTVTIQILVL